MQRKVILKALSLIFVIVTLLSVAPLSVFAADSGVIEVSDVCADLKEMGIDITKYQKDPDATHCRMLKFLEYGYDYYGGTSDYGLYVYIYNPTGKEIDINADRNYIQMQILSSAGTVQSGWRKMKLKMCSYSTTQGYEHVFYKFKIEGAKNIHVNLEKGMRQYDVSGIELKHKGETNAKDYKIAGTFTFTGYMPYHGVERYANSTLKSYIRDRVTVDIELNPVSWKTKTSDKGAGYQYEVFGVYFAVPNDIIRDYGNTDDVYKGLVRVDGTFEEYKVNGIVTNNQDVYNAVEPWLGADVAESSGNIPFAFFTPVVRNSGTVQYCRYDFNGALYSSNTYVKVGEEPLSSIGNVFKIEGDSFTISSDFASSNYMPNVEEGRKRGKQDYYVESGDEKEKLLNNQIASYASNHNAFLSWLNGEGELYIKDESYSSIQPIEVISDLDFALNGVILNNAAIAERVFVQESDVSDLKKFVASSTLKDKTTYMMRFAVRDYYCVDIDMSNKAAGFFENSYYSGDNFYFEKTIFNNFDVLSFTYENKYGEQTIIPVVTDPIFVGGVITPPADGENPNTEPKDKGDGEDRIGCQDLSGTSLFILFLVVFLLLWGISKIFKIGILDIVFAPFRLLSALVNWIFGIGDKTLTTSQKRQNLKSSKQIEKDRRVDRDYDNKVKKTKDEQHNSDWIQSREERSTRLDIERQKAKDAHQREVNYQKDYERNEKRRKEF